MSLTSQFSQNRICILFSALGCLVRPTNAVIWTFLYANLLWAVRHQYKFALKILQDLLVTACVIALIVIPFPLLNCRLARPRLLFSLSLIQCITTNQHLRRLTSYERTSPRFRFSTAQTLGITISLKPYLSFVQQVYLLCSTEFGLP